MILATWAFAGTLTDATGRTVKADADDRLVVLSGGITESVYALGAGDRVVGIDSSSVFPPAVQQLPSVGYFRQLGAEGVLSLGPDLVIAPDDAGPPGVLDQLRTGGARVAVLPSVQSVDGAKQRLVLLGDLLDAPDEARRLVTSMERTLATVVRPEDPPRVLFVYARGSGTLQVAGQDTVADAMIGLAGGTNAVSGFNGYRPLTAEAVVVAAPEVILLTERGLAALGGPAAVLSQPGVGSTPAGVARRVVTLDDLLLLGFGPRTGEGVVALARILAGQ